MLLSLSPRALVALVLLATLAVCAPASAGTPATVGVRVQGQATTLLPYTTVTTTNTAPPTDSAASGTSAAGALDLATRGNWDRKCFADTILGETHTYTHNDYWAFWLGHGGTYAYSQSGICTTELSPGDEVLMVADTFAATPTVYPLSLAGVPASVQQGASFGVTVLEYQTDGSHTTPAGAGGAVISGGGSTATAGPSGQATIVLNQPGTYALTATKASRVPALPVQVCVHNGNDGNCGTGPGGAPGAGQTAAGVSSSAGLTGQLGGGLSPAPRSPIGRILGLADGHYFRHGGPRQLRASVLSNGSGVARVRLRLERQWRGSCQGYDGRTERLRRIRCGARHAPWLDLGARSDVSYLLPFALPAGRYVLDLQVIARDGRRDDMLARGRNRILFWVGSGARTATRAPGTDGTHRTRARVVSGRARRAPRPPTTPVMVVGRDRLLYGPTPVRAAPVQVRVGSRQCAVAAATPLAALEQAHRQGGPAVRLRDYGSCSASPRDSASLFAYQIGAEPNRGQDGWVYKVGHRVGTAGAGDPGGPLGHGRLRSGERVLWFWCRHGGACQRTLEVSGSWAGIRAGQRVGVTVTGFDDNGVGTPVVGATVTLGPVSATTGADGKAFLSAPGAGTHVLRAVAGGLVPAFPEPVVVR